MANVRLVFKGNEESETDYFEMVCFANTLNQIYISIDCKDFPPSFICLDKSTAIKFAKTLRTEINKLQENETE